MGQVALGIRSLLVKLAVFFVLAALLAWALGGTLFPRAEVATLSTVRFAEREWRLRVAVGGDHPGVAHYELVRIDEKGRPEPVVEACVDAAPLAILAGTLVAPMQARRDGPWTLHRFDGSGHDQSETLPDRYAVERRLRELSQ